MEVVEGEARTVLKISNFKQPFSKKSGQASSSFFPSSLSADITIPLRIYQRLEGVAAEGVRMEAVKEGARTVLKISFFHFQKNLVSFLCFVFYLSFLHSSLLTSQFPSAFIKGLQALLVSQYQIAVRGKAPGNLKW